MHFRKIVMFWILYVGISVQIMDCLKTSFFLHALTSSTRWILIYLILGKQILSIVVVHIWLRCCFNLIVVFSSLLYLWTCMFIHLIFNAFCCSLTFPLWTHMFGYPFHPPNNVRCNILKRVPNSAIWLLRFPAAGERRLRDCKYLYLQAA